MSEKKLSVITTTCIRILTVVNIKLKSKSLTLKQWNDSTSRNSLQRRIAEVWNASLFTLQTWLHEAVIFLMENITLISIDPNP
jgi:hypothetical protein